MDSALGILDLDGNVRADIDSRGELSRLTTEHLTFLTNSSIALTDSSFKLLSPRAMFLAADFISTALKKFIPSNLKFG